MKLSFFGHSIKRLVLRRHFAIPQVKLHTYPLRELVRLVSLKLGLDLFTSKEHGWASIDQVCEELDRHVASSLQFKSVRGTISAGSRVSGVYCYEDVAYHTFHAARALGLKCFYDLPIPYWETVQAILRQEAERYPEWAATMTGITDSPQKLQRKSAEIDLADVILCASHFTYTSLPARILQSKTCVIAEYGVPDMSSEPDYPLPVRRPHDPLRVLFVGSMTQRKGLADIFAAMKILNRKDVELIVLGTPVVGLDFYRQQFPNFRYEPPRPHADVLSYMRSCDVFVFPSLAEGRGLVQLEAMSCGLPLITTYNATGENLIDEGKTGFLVPVRSPHEIADKINWFADHRVSLEEMRNFAKKKVAQWTWSAYSDKVVQVIRSVICDTGCALDA